MGDKPRTSITMRFTWKTGHCRECGVNFRIGSPTRKMLHIIAVGDAEENGNGSTRKWHAKSFVSFIVMHIR